MHLGAASMIGATGSNGSDNGVPEDFDALTFTSDDLYEVSSIGYTVHNLVINDPKKISNDDISCLLYTSPSPRDGLLSRMPSSA